MWAAWQSSDSKLRRNQTLSWKIGYPLAGVWHHSSLRCWETVECGQASFRSKEAAAGDWVLLLRTLWKFIQKYIHLHSTPPEERTNHLSHTFQPKPWTYPYSCHIRNKLTAPSRGEQAKGPVVCCSRGPIKPCSGKKKKKKRNIYIYISPTGRWHTWGPKDRTTGSQFINMWHAFLVVQQLRICVPMQETWIQSLGWEDCLEEEMTTPSSILAWEIPRT